MWRVCHGTFRTRTEASYNKSTYQKLIWHIGPRCWWWQRHRCDPVWRGANRHGPIRLYSWRLTWHGYRLFNRCLVLWESFLLVTLRVDRRRALQNGQGFVSDRTGERNWHMRQMIWPSVKWSIHFPCYPSFLCTILDAGLGVGAFVSRNAMRLTVSPLRKPGFISIISGWKASTVAGSILCSQ